jgi:hypothetical protein
METINHIINVADSIFERLPEQIMPINSTALAASVIILSVLFTAPNRPTQIVRTIALASIGVSRLICTELCDGSFCTLVRISWRRAVSEKSSPIAEKIR